MWWRPSGPTLYARIDARFEQMIAAGALEEVQQLASLGLDPQLPIMSALGVRPLMQHLTGAVALADAVAAAQTETRQYAKRQLTWARGNMISWKWISEKEMESKERDFVSFIDH